MKPRTVGKFHFDGYLLMAVILLLALGLLMVSSTSIVIANKWHHFAFYYLIKQLIFLSLGLILIVVFIRIPIQIWYQTSYYILFLGVIALLLVLVPGIGHKVNGSMRWIHLGFFNAQPSELTKLAFIIYMASYINRYHALLNEDVSSFVRPILLLGLLCILLLVQPDFGAVVVLVATAMVMLFLAGVRLWQFLALFMATALCLALLAVSSPYRLQRLMTFLEPWANQFDSGYQLTQSLIAFGRGGWFGVGLGESVQKLFYLPEAHTDFLFAILAEELGFVGVLLVFGLFILLVGRGFIIAKHALQREQVFSGFLAYGISFCLTFQIIISIGVNIGLLPTKGLTLPLMSYGGSSLLISCCQVALLFRINHENHNTKTSRRGMLWQN